MTLTRISRLLRYPGGRFVLGIPVVIVIGLYLYGRGRWW